MRDTDWRPGPSPKRRVGKPKPVEYYILMNWDGGEGTRNTPSGYIVENKTLAEKWTDMNMGASYNTVKGVLVHSFDDIPEAAEALARQKALDKLTDKEKELLGLAPKTKERIPPADAKIRDRAAGLGLGPED